ncbi:serine/threonine protein phosphatase [Novosphingobium sp. NBM11]|uniref:metallophosphoesterase family protein n=1 Tax=Novosphingobium sp. NBM11 TaxID=2596914 RepID=UPI0018920F2F|nr:metallophosphoesterase family protein [Novosphingobium sp. NBM11]MBF5091531.1 serine/threonine protein phosphatase [Novosphingobium sp. NBM11]
MTAQTRQGIVYAVGDIHGRDDLLRSMLDLIQSDASQHAPEGGERPMVVFLGDYIDRGGQSRQVIDTLLDFSATPAFESRFLLGNHEEAMLDFLEERSSGIGWGKHGGTATLRSYGVAPPPMNMPEPWAAARTALAQALPRQHLDFLSRLEPFITVNHIVFVHAGLRPGVDLDAQSLRDLLWIRSEFLETDQDDSRLIVHGHTPGEAVYGAPGRLCLDSGAYMSGRLSGAAFLGHDVRILEATARGGKVQPYTLYAG